MARVSLCDTTLDAPGALAAFEAEAEGAGAIVSFTGLVRPAAEGETVKGLQLDAYSPLTETSIEAMIGEAERRWPLMAVRVIHRIGRIAPGETIVFVATASGHRRAAFEAADYLMDYLKSEAPFWKKELRETGAVWIEPRAEDYRDKARWAAPAEES